MVACIILNYNSANDTRKLASTIQEYSTINHIVIVDNNSPDKSGQYLKSLDIWNEKIHFILLEDNYGYAKGNNIGARYAINELKCDYIIIANPDVEFEMSYVTEVKQLIQGNKDVIVASAIAHDADGVVSYRSYWDIPTYKDYVRKFFPPLNRRYEQRQLKRQMNVQTPYLLVGAVSGACFMADKKLFLEIGGIVEDTFLYCEESILGGVLAKQGYQEAVSFLTHYNHNHIYKAESHEKKLKQYRIMLTSRRYYLKTVLGVNKIQLGLFDVLSTLSIKVKTIFWRL